MPDLARMDFPAHSRPEFPEFSSFAGMHEGNHIDNSPIVLDNFNYGGIAQLQYDVLHQQRRLDVMQFHRPNWQHKM